MKYRQEHDSLGSVDVPEAALYGAQTQRALNNFPISGLIMPVEFIRALGLLKAACAKVSGETGAIPAEIAAAIVTAATEIAEGRHYEAFGIDVFQTGSGTSTNMNANEVIAHLAGAASGLAIHPNDHVNYGQSSNDVIPSCIHLSAALAVEQTLLPALAHLQQTISTKAETVGGIVKTGRTHLMDAMPVTLAQELGGWAQQIAYARSRISESMCRLRQLAIGGTAVGTGVNAPQGFADRVVVELRRATGVEWQVADNYFQALSAQDAALELSGHLKNLATTLTKISNDLRWMNSGPLAGLAEIQLPALQPGSSIMPGKVNPVIPEAVAMAAAQVTGNDATITMAAQSGNFQLNVMLPVIAYNLLQSLQIMASSSVVLADKAIAGFTVNTDHIEQALRRNPILVTALNERIGYEQGAAIAKQAFKEQRPVIDVACELTDISREELEQLLDPARLTGV